MNGHDLNKSLARMIRNRYYDLVLADTLRYIALALISLFVPIFLLKLNYSIFVIAVFELGVFIGSIIFHFILLKNINKIKVKRAMIFSYLADIIFYLFLYNASLIMDAWGPYSLLLILSFINIIASTFYWTAHHIYFFNSSDAKNGGRLLGILNSIPVAIGVISPFLGGVLISNFGFHITFFISILLLILASIVLLFSRGIEADIYINIEKVFDFNYDIKNWIYFIEGLNYVATVFIWPIFMFVMAIKIISMGLIYLFANMAYSIFTYFGGKISDQHGSRLIGRIGSVGHSLSLVFRALSENVLMMSFSVTLGGFFGSLMHVALDSGFYKHSHEYQGSAIMNREMYMHLGRISLVLLFLFTLLFLEAKTALMVIIFFAAFLTFILNFIIEKDKSIID